MTLLSVSEVLTTKSQDLLAALYSKVNDHDLDTDHVRLQYELDDIYVNVTLTARSLTEQMAPGRYTGQTKVRYKRESLQTLLHGSPTFFMATDWPVTFQQIVSHLKSTYGILLENQDVYAPNTQSVILDTHQFEQAAFIGSNGTIELKIADTSPRFIPHSLGGDSIRVRVIDPYDADLDLLGPTKLLPAVTTVDV